MPILFGIFLLLFALSASGQSTGTVYGQVTDPSGSAVGGARVMIENALTGYRRETLTAQDGSFTFTNAPLQSYTLRTEHIGFGPDRQEVAIRSNVPVAVTVNLKLAGQTDSVSVSATEAAPLIQTESTGTRTELNAAEMERMPAQIGSRGLESVLVSLPGFAANANGAIHPRGAHNQMTYVIDGMPISDQLTGAFASSMDASIVQTIELYTGNVLPEYGSKVSGVANITTRSGIGSGRRFAGSTQATAAGFGTLGNITQFAGGTDRFGYFASFFALESNRYLDQVSLDNLHNGGNSERAFGRLDFHRGPHDVLRLNLMAGRSSFQLANLPSQHAAGQDQHQLLKDGSVSLGWLHMLDAASTVDVMVSHRSSTAQLFPSAGDTPVTASQARRLSTFTLAGRYNRVAGIHTFRGGGDWQHFPVREHFFFAITDPRFNAPAASGFIPTLAPYDLSRGGDWFRFSEKRSGDLYSGFLQDTLRLGRLTFSLGARWDAYRFLVDGKQFQPRVGLAFHLRETGTVLRVSYNRNYQTPPNENLLLSSSEEASVLVPPAVKDALGGAFKRIRPERQNVYEAGLQQQLGSHLGLNAAFYHKNAHDMQDNDNFFNTGIIFPTALARSRVNGAEARITVLPVAGFSGSLSLTHYHAVVTPPFTGGLFLGSTALNLLTAGPFIIDHDQTLGAHGVVHYSPRRDLWFSSSIRYDSGLVSNPSDPVQVAADPDYAALLPYVNLAGDPPRVRPRTIVDIGVGYERIRNERRTWDVQFSVQNIANRTALYNFQSIFVGTRLVQPRTAGVKLRWHW
jgi:hypothetical protein